MVISISARIRHAMLALSIVPCAVFTALVFILVYALEDQVFTNQIKAERHAYQNSGNASSWQPANTNIRKLNSASELPAFFPRSIVHSIVNEKGIHEYFDDVKAVFVAHYTHTGSGESYFLIYDVSAFLAVRGTKSKMLTLISIVTALIIALAIAFAHRLSKTTLAPVRELTNALQTRDFDELVIEQANQFSQDEIGILTQELALALERARDAAQREYEFNRGVSHELRTPIQAAQSTNELLNLCQQQLTPGQQDPRQLKYLQRLGRALEEMNQVVEAFLWLSHDHNRNKTGRCHVHSLSQMLSDYESQPPSTTGSHQQKNRRINVTVDKQLSAADTYPLPESVLLIIMRSLLKNALIHSNQGDIEVSLGMKSIIIVNHIASKTKRPTNQPSGWGIGLTIVSRLCECFQCRLVINDKEDSQFSAEIIIA